MFDQEPEDEMAEHCRRLVKERDKFQKLAGEFQTAMEREMTAAGDARRERDEARRIQEAAEKHARRSDEERDQANERLLRHTSDETMPAMQELTRQRDEANARAEKAEASLRSHVASARRRMKNLLEEP